MPTPSSHLHNFSANGGALFLNFVSEILHSSLLPCHALAFMDLVDDTKSTTIDDEALANAKRRKEQWKLAKVQMHQFTDKMKHFNGLNYPIKDASFWAMVENEIESIVNLCEEIDLVELLAPLRKSMQSKEPRMKIVYIISFVGEFFNWTIFAWNKMGHYYLDSDELNQRWNLVSYCLKMVNKYYCVYRKTISDKSGGVFRFQHPVYFDMAKLYQFKGPETLGHALKYYKLYLECQDSKWILKQTQEFGTFFVPIVKQLIPEIETFVREYNDFVDKKCNSVNPPKFETRGWWEKYESELNPQGCVIL